MGLLFSQNKFVQSLGLSAAIALSATAMVAPSAEAFTVKGWEYSMDSFNDSTGAVNGRLGIGEATDYEIRGIATQLLDGKVRIAVQSNLGLGGAAFGSASGGRISWGDLIINTACEALDHVSSDSLFGIRFADNNESGVGQIGLYGNVSLFERADENTNPANSFGGHNQLVSSRGGSPSTGTLPENYFNQNTHVPTLMSSGNYLGAVNVLQNPSGWGLDGFAGLSGQIIGLEFDASLLSLEDGQKVCVHTAPECNNDIAGGQFTVDTGTESIAVPTPAAVLPLLSGMFAAAKRKKDQEEVA